MSINKKRFASIIAEYNPLHDGHCYHIDRTVELLKPDFTVIVMSGSFTQRGTHAILDKYTRAAHAILAGADIVIELPTIFALSNAEYFAKGGVKLLSAIEGGGYLSFGSESGNIDALTRLATLMKAESADISRQIKENLKEMPFPAARAKAYSDYATSMGIEVPDIACPNNMLGLEYLKALFGLEDRLMPFTLKREGAGYHSMEENSPYISSKFARACIKDSKLNFLRGKLPDYVLEDIGKLSHKDNSAIILHKLQEMDAGEIAILYDVKEGLHNRIKRYADSALNYEDFSKSLQTKRYTASRLRRIIIYALLGITRDLHDYAKSSPPYFNVLAVRGTHTRLLSELSGYGELFTSNRQMLESSNPLAQLDAKAFRTRELLTEQKAETGMLIIK